jgi:hypothetical protein
MRKSPSANELSRQHSSNQADVPSIPDGLSDPIIQMLLRGDAETVAEAEEIYLDANLHRVIELVESALSDEEFRAHPLITLLLSHGSRDFEDSIL